MRPNEPGCALSPKVSRFVDAVAAGAGTVEAARQAGISRSTATRWLRREDVQAELAARAAEDADVAARARADLAAARSAALGELAADLTGLVRELRRRAFREPGSPGVRALVELLRIGGLVPGVEPEDEAEQVSASGTIDANSSDEEVAARYLALVGGIRG